MKPWQKGLTIHNQAYNSKELLSFSSDNIVSAINNTWEKEVYRFIINWLSDSDYMAQYSSGTTGKSKEIRLPKLSMMASALNTCRFFSLTKGQSALLCMPVDYIAGKMMIVRSLVGELNLQLNEPKSVPDISGRRSIDFCAMLPLQVMNLLTCRKALDPIKKLIIGGTEINAELEALIQPVPTEVYATYGMAETSSHVALRRLNGSDRQEAYHALPGITLTLDERGCLVIEADYLPNRVVTNDLVTFTGSGSFTWLGRYDNLINSGGIKIVPEEVETMVMSKTMLACTVIGLPDKKLGQRLVFVFENDQAPDSFSLLKTDFENLLPRHWRPKDIVCVEKIPRNDSMKVDRRMLIEILSMKHP
jgi:O-succinylbenzoic acid--CoA ligase